MNIIKFALKKGADDVVVEKADEIMKQIRFSNNLITVSKVWKTSVYKVFLTRNKRVVSTVIYDTRKKSIKNAIENLIKATKIIEPNKDYYGIAKGPFKYKKIPRLFDKKLLNVDCVDLVEAAINSALKYSKKTAGTFVLHFLKRNLETSSKISASEKTTAVSLSIRAFNEKDESGHAVSCSRILSEFRPEKAGEKAGKIAKLAKKPKEGKKGKFDVIFDPLSIANLLSLVGQFSSIFYVESGLSFLRDKLNKKVGSEKVTLIDDGRIENGVNSTLFDEEGVPTMRKVIIDKGILKTYLHNTSTAKKYNVETTGNAGLITPSPTNIILEKGKLKKEELFEKVKNGLYITNVWYTRFQNYVTGDFSTIPRDGIFLIRKGEIVRSLKNIRISDNLERILLNVIDISNKPEWIHWWEVQFPVLTPYVLVKNVNISKPI